MFRSFFILTFLIQIILPISTNSKNSTNFKTHNRKLLTTCTTHTGVINVKYCTGFNGLWANANTYCTNNFNSELVTVTSDDDHTALKAIVTDDAWIGCWNPDNGECEWQDGSPDNYRNWANNEPDGNGKKCVYMKKDKNYKWSDGDCSTEKATFLCNWTPTNSPSKSPTKKPTKVPTKSPSKFPTKSPSKYPSNFPSKSPSDGPTNAPSNSPTFLPTNSPSVSPTSIPSDTPTDLPSNSPSNSPAHDPTDSPTNTPTMRPSTAPNHEPSYSPTELPTSSPTYMPSNSPSVIPTNTPTASPTNYPSQSPSNVPTDTPSNSPVNVPSNSPTNIPTNSPTNTPTGSPSISPTNTPSNSPSNSPSNTPSNTPTNTPTNSPVSSNNASIIATQISQPFILFSIIISLISVIIILLICYLKQRNKNIKNKENIKRMTKEHVEMDIVNSNSVANVEKIAKLAIIDDDSNIDEIQAKKSTSGIVKSHQTKSGKSVDPYEELYENESEKSDSNKNEFETPNNENEALNDLHNEELYNTQNVKDENTTTGGISPTNVEDDSENDENSISSGGSENDDLYVPNEGKGNTSGMTKTPDGLENEAIKLAKSMNEGENNNDFNPVKTKLSYGETSHEL